MAIDPRQDFAGRLREQIPELEVSPRPGIVPLNMLLIRVTRVNDSLDTLDGDADLYLAHIIFS